MLEGLFGNKSAEKVMLSILAHGEIHASAIAKEHNTAIDPIKKQLERFLESGFLTSRIVGRSRLYRFNELNPMVAPLKELLVLAPKIKSKSNQIKISEQTVRTL